MHGQALALTPQGDRLVRMEDLPARSGYSDYELGGTARGIDLHGIWGVFVRHWPMMLAIVLLALALGAASVMLTRPVYSAHASLQIETQEPRILAAENVTPDAPQSENSRTLQTQMELLVSRSTARNVAERMNLANDSAFLRDAGLAGTPPGNQRLAAVTSAVQSGLEVSVPGDTRIITVNYKSHDPAFAARAANMFAATFRDDSLQRRLDTYAYSRNFLQGQLESTKGRLERSERDLVSYARSAGLVDASNAAGAGSTDGERRSITTASLVDLNAALSAAQANRMQAQSRWQQAMATPVMSLPEVLGNPAIQNLTRQRAELEATLQQERQRRQDEHPAIIQAKAQIAEMDRQIGTIAAGVRASIGNQYRAAAGQESALRGNVNALKSASFNEQSKGVRYNILKREVDTNRNLFNTLLQRFHEVSTQAANTTNPISIIDRAQVPSEPSYPRPALNMALASLAGVALALAAGFARNRMDDKVHGPGDVERDFRAPLLGVVPLLKNAEDMGRALDDPRSPVTEAHHAICLALDPVARTPDHAVLLLTSTSPNEGKSTTAFKLAAHFAAADKNVLVIDGDMRRGSLHIMLDLSNRSGLADILARKNNAGLSDAVQYCDRYGFSVLTRGRSSANPAELLASGRFEALLDEAVRCYDAVIIDGPPVLGLADAPRLSGLADATVFVVEANRTSKEHARTAIRRLTDAGAEQVGMVITKYDPAKDTGAYGYGYRYDYESDDEPEVEEPRRADHDEQLQLAV